MLDLPVRKLSPPSWLPPGATEEEVHAMGLLIFTYGKRIKARALNNKWVYGTVERMFMTDVGESRLQGVFEIWDPNRRRKEYSMRVVSTRVVHLVEEKSYVEEQLCSL